MKKVVIVLLAFIVLACNVEETPSILKRWHLVRVHSIDSKTVEVNDSGFYWTFMSDGRIAQEYSKDCSLAIGLWSQDNNQLSISDMTCDDTGDSFGVNGNYEILSLGVNMLVLKFDDGSYTLENWE